MYATEDMSSYKKLSSNDNDDADKRISRYDRVFAEFLSNMHGRDFSDDINNISSIQEKLKHMKEESQLKYLSDLMHPEKAMHAKIPSNVPFPSSSFKMHNTATISTNASGNFVFTLNPFALSSGATIYSGMSVNNDVSLSGSAANPLFVGTYIGSAIPDIYSEYRLVSCACTVITRSSTLNVSGTLSGSIIIDPLLGYVPPTIANATPANYAQFSTIDDAYYNQIVKASEGLRMLYFPIDTSYETYQAIGGQSNPVPKGAFNFICYGQGLQPNFAGIRIDLYLNFEGIANAQNTQFIPRSMGSACDPDVKNKAIQETQKNSVSSLADYVAPMIEARQNDVEMPAISKKTNGTLSFLKDTLGTIGDIFATAASDAFQSVPGISGLSSGVKQLSKSIMLPNSMLGNKTKSTGQSLMATLFGIGR